MPAPLIEFAKFARPHQWWLRRGEPPWLEDSRCWVRAFRVTFVLGLLGLATGWVTVMMGFLLRNWETALDHLVNTELVLFLGPGLVFGVGALVPLSRWLGRGWIMTLLAVPASMLACYCGVSAFLLTGPFMSSGAEWVPGGEDAAGFYAGFAGAFVLSLWMGHPRRKPAWIAGLLATGLASPVCGVFFLNPGLLDLPLVPGLLKELLHSVALYGGFQSLTAVGLGARLWWPTGVLRDGEKERVRD